MGRKIKNRIGEQFGKWTVKEFSHIDKRPSKNITYWICSCACGTVKAANINNLRSGKSMSCGCARGKTIHGMYGTPTYRSWFSMKQRCFNIKNIDYHNYGGRGISVCDRWKM